jgi:hypothetical protein
MQVYIHCEFRQLSRRVRLGTPTAGYRQVVQGNKCLQGAVIAAVPGRRKYRKKSFAQNCLEAVSAANDVTAYFIWRASGSKLLFFALLLMIFMSPSMLMPAPQFSSSAAIVT